jgi:hypothetical protein
VVRAGAAAATVDEAFEGCRLRRRSRSRPVRARRVWRRGSYVGRPSVLKPLALVLHWNGSSWQQVAIPHYGPKGSPNLLTAVSASSSGDVVAVGYYSGLVGQGQQALVLRLRA